MKYWITNNFLRYSRAYLFRHINLIVFPSLRESGKFMWFEFQYITELEKFFLFVRGVKNYFSCHVKSFDKLLKNKNLSCVQKICEKFIWIL
jgi:hypothetical protein